MGAVLCLTTSILFSWYAQNFGSFSVLYGSLGSVVAFMTWALAVLIGAEFDAAATAVFLEQHLSGQQSHN